ncbi:MAG: glycosyltransferase family 4 protein, partial [Coleofasciculaceae cyanobacterium SM2_3_26]|nr:glycosyltransferase family 4 protein [Coleofasciculaceae cyanobacterium SM2_3_26]
MMRSMGVQHSLREIHEDSDTIIITCSHWSKAGLVRSGAVSDRVVVIPVGVDPSLYKPLPETERTALRKHMGWEGKFVFLCIGSDFERKGVYPLLKAFASICDRYPQAHVMLKGTEAICGSRESLEHALNQVLTPSQAARVRDRISYTGDSLSLTQMVQLYQAADAYASPYIAEGFNIPVLEA